MESLFRCPLPTPLPTLLPSPIIGRFTWKNQRFSLSSSLIKESGWYQKRTKTQSLENLQQDFWRREEMWAFPEVLGKELIWELLFFVISKVTSLHATTAYFCCLGHFAAWRNLPIMAMYLSGWHFLYMWEGMSAHRTRLFHSLLEPCMGKPVSLQNG